MHIDNSLKKKKETIVQKNEHDNILGYFDNAKKRGPEPKSKAVVFTTSLSGGRFGEFKFKPRENEGECQ